MPGDCCGCGCGQKRQEGPNPLSSPWGISRASSNPSQGTVQTSAAFLSKKSEAPSALALARTVFPSAPCKLHRWGFLVVSFPGLTTEIKPAEAGRGEKPLSPRCVELHRRFPGKSRNPEAFPPTAERNRSLPPPPGRGREETPFGSPRDLFLQPQGGWQAPRTRVALSLTSRQGGSCRLAEAATASAGQPSRSAQPPSQHSAPRSRIIAQGRRGPRLRSPRAPGGASPGRRRRCCSGGCFTLACKRPAPLRRVPGLAPTAALPAG